MNVQRSVSIRGITCVNLFVILPLHQCYTPSDNRRQTEPQNEKSDGVAFNNFCRIFFRVLPKGPFFFMYSKRITKIWPSSQKVLE